MQSSSPALPPALETLCLLLNSDPSTATSQDWTNHPDLEQVVETAHGHNTLGVILPTMRLLDEFVSPRLQKRLAASEQLLAGQSLFLQHELQSVLSILDAAGVEAVALKGAFLASCVYPDFLARPMNDFDLLVKKETLEPAAMALRDAGYVCQDGRPDQVPPGGSLEFCSPAGHAIELRYELTQGTRLRGVFRFREEEMWEQRRTYETLYGMKLLSLSPTDHLLYLVYHAGILHLFTALIWLVDLDRFIRMYREEIGWTDLTERARTIGCATCLWHGLSLAKELLRTPVEDALLQALRPNALRAALIRQWLGPQRALQGMTPPRQPRMQALQMLLFDSIATDIQSLRQGLFPPRDWLSWRYQTSHPVGLSFLRAVYPLGGWTRARK